MNLANRITLFRFFLTPIYCLFFALGFLVDSPVSWAVFPMLFLFVLSEISDIADGWVARRHYLVTDLGKLMDPFADVIFRISYLFLFSLLALIPWWAVLIILWREFTIQFIRMLLMKEGRALAAGILGKLKAVSYFITGVCGQLYLWLGGQISWGEQLRWILYLLGILSAGLALISLIHYLVLFSSHKKSNKE